MCSRPGRADAAHVGLAGQLELSPGSFDVVLYRLVLHHIAYHGSLGPCFSEAATLLRPGGVLIAIEPGLWHPVGCALAIANTTGLATRIHGTPDDIPLSPRELTTYARTVGLRPEIHAVTYTWRRLPPTLQRIVQPLDRLGSRPRLAPFGHTLMLIARRPGADDGHDRRSARAVDWRLADARGDPAARGRAPRRGDRLARSRSTTATPTSSAQPLPHAFLEQLAALGEHAAAVLPAADASADRAPGVAATAGRARRALLVCVVLFVALRRPLGTRAALLATLATAVSPFLVTYSNLARGFMLEDLALLLALWAMLRLIDGASPRWWALYLLAGGVSRSTASTTRSSSCSR